MDQNPRPSESHLSTATAAAASLSEDAATMWQHYTVQACEPRLRMGQEPIITTGESRGSHLRMGQQDPVTTGENCESHLRMGQEHVTTGENPNMNVGTVGGMENGQTITISEKEEGKECSNSAGEVCECEDTQVRDISLAVAALVPLPCSSSPADSQQTSLTSSCFVTPASTPSRSPSPPPHSPLHPSQQVALPHGEFVDGCQDNEQDNTNHSDGPFDPHSLVAARLPTMIDAETQTHSITAVDSFSQTHATVTQDSSTNTEKEEPPDLIDVESQTDGNEGWEGERREVGCNTQLQISPELLERAQLAEELVRLRSELAAGVLERNEAKSQQMVAEELSRIVQSELVELRQRNVAETTTRVRLENQLGGLKVELSSARKEAREKEERITELEETLKGTSLLVRKLEEQNAVSLMNRGGIDYMLQAKLADARAQEVEQKLEVAQTELLHSQGEVKRLLDRVGEATRNRSEMVSSKVHNQLLQIADERAQSAEQKALQLERQLLSVRDKYGHPETSHPSTFTRPSTYTSTLGGYPSFSSTLIPPYTSSSPYSLSTSLSTHLPPSTSGLSLEPFKLSFSLPSSSPSLPTTDHLRPLPDSERAALPTSTGSSSHPLLSSSADEHTSLLKPSTVLGKGAGSGKRDVIPVVTSSSSSELGQDTTLPSVELPEFSLPPPDSSSFPASWENDRESSSSDWSSSDEDDDEGSEVPLRPSTHSALQAQWEWRTMADSLPDNSPMATGHTPKKKPPPIAPKPRVSWTHSLPTTDLNYQLTERPSSFSQVQPTHVSDLTSLTSSFPRPRGPQGRNLPSRLYK